VSHAVWRRMDSVVDAWCVGEDMEGSGHVIVEVLLLHRLG
jgi:hypothetical protein